MRGRDDQLSQVSCMYALEKTIKIGIISGSQISNVERREGVFEMSGPKIVSSTDEPIIEEEGSAFLDIAAKLLEDPPGIPYKLTFYTS